MTRFYYLKCKKETETASEIQDMTTNGRYHLHGDCVVCGMHKNTFTGIDWVIKKKPRRRKKKPRLKDIKRRIIGNAKNSGKKF
ncbi:hypothetical protein GLOIN_2v1788557 [Rhizophagus irregularis DAOM 181602=DAOM 197198]|nr:hypothetical protein GLOIN_2v1788557 [Rhizophagus irregularis DAOM 181602=DAOM 197198]